MGMETDTKEFLVRIVNTISLVLIWMFLNLIIGIYNGLAFFENDISWKNILYYIFFLSSLIMLLAHLKKRWKL
jgi:hypothetical protein